MKKIGLLLISLLLTSSLLFASGASETEAPVEGSSILKKNVQCIIPYSPGGGSDILTRTIMKYIDMEKPLVAINVDGAGGMIGCMQAFHSPNDGYTILAHNPMDVVSYSLSGQTEIELWSELTTICNVVSDFNVVSTNVQSGWTTLEEMVEYAKANPGEIKWGVTGAQTVNMADTERIVKALGLTGLVTLVPYDGGAASKTALLGNHIQVETNSSSDIRSSVQSGDCIPLMVVSDARIQALPEIPTTVEKGINVSTAKPRGYYAPKGTPQVMVDYLANAIKEVTEMDEFAEAVGNLGLQVDYMTGPESLKKVSSWVEEVKPFFEQFN